MGKWYLIFLQFMKVSLLIHISKMALGCMQQALTEVLLIHLNAHFQFELTMIYSLLQGLHSISKPDQGQFSKFGFGSLKASNLFLKYDELDFTWIYAPIFRYPFLTVYHFLIAVLPTSMLLWDLVSLIQTLSNQFLNAQVLIEWLLYFILPVLNRECLWSIYQQVISNLIP